ncbi:acireductone synthase [Leptospira fluminis]|uniref:Acireductone synthase n=1 Tax=Leptospira fluminis TaxID=2484979 RepID=A0A4R9GLG3_9LEPT|nr:acireductone synthase [Leptospira fluminis]TGK15240.1 acireductone synthase [Leptospira fluminis]
MKQETPNVFLFDIEGTTTPIEFVHKVLFPYSDSNFLSFFREQFPEERRFEEFKIASEKETEFDGPLEKNPESLSRFCSYLVSKDRKLGALKETQGKIWKRGYESGELKSTIFSDVPRFLGKIRNAGKSAAVYSSGSVEAQVLIFRYCEAGDLTPYFRSYFDTEVGGKREPQSYLAIADKLAVSPGKIVFFTDIKEEAEAAISVGIRPFIMERPGNLPQGSHQFPILRTFDDVPPDFIGT